MNPWRDVIMPEDAIAGKPTEHYTIEEAEDIISALVDHVDCQLSFALSAFLGMRPHEIAALRWDDFSTKEGLVHIRRGVVAGNVGTPKTLESVRSVPLIVQVRLLLALWWEKCEGPKDSWLFASRNDTPVDLHNVTARIIVPHITGARKCVRCDRKPKATKLKWKGLYAGRRGACTAVVEATGGNYAVAQALLGHKSMTTTLNVYKKQITPKAFKDGMRVYELATSKSERN